VYARVWPASYIGGSALARGIQFCYFPNFAVTLLAGAMTVTVSGGSNKHEDSNRSLHGT
jgi:hypothetical protein